jgi:hypothetical protein
MNRDRMMDLAKRMLAMIDGKTTNCRRPASTALRYGCKDVIDDEDSWVTGLAEVGIHAPSAPTDFVIGSNEPAIQHIHRLFSEQAEEARFPGILRLVSSSTTASRTVHFPPGDDLIA